MYNINEMLSLKELKSLCSTNIQLLYNLMYKCKTMHVTCGAPCKREGGLSGVKGRKKGPFLLSPVLTPYTPAMQATACAL